MAAKLKQAIFNMSVSVEEDGDNAFSGGPFWHAAMAFAATLAKGTTAGKVDLAYMAERTIAGHADTPQNDDIDLNGSLTSPTGISFAAVEIVGIIIINAPKDPNAAPNTTALSIGNEGTNPFEGFISADGVIGPIQPGGMVALFSPGAAGLGAVVAETGDKLRVTNANAVGAPSNKYQICLLGRTA